MEISDIIARVWSKVESREDDEEDRIAKAELEECKSVADILHFLRDQAWDLESAANILNEIMGLYQQGIWHSDTAQICVALAVRYDVPEECFDGWST